MSLLLLILALLSSTLIGYLVSAALVPVSRPAWGGFLLKLSLGAGVGAGLSSVLYFLTRLLIGPSTAVYASAELALLAAAAAGFWFARARRPAFENAQSQPRGWFWMLLVALLVALAIAVPLFADTSSTNPYGGWDAWAIWNLRAKLLAQPDATWRNAFAPVLNQLAGGGATHPEYPLLLSGYIARSWDMMGDIGNVGAPIATAALFSFATLGLIVSALALLRGWSAGMLGGLILLGSAGFNLDSPWQLADVPIAFYYLAFFALLLLSNAEDPSWRASVTLAGLTMGLAPWTKKEGLLFALAAGIGFLACTFLSRRTGRVRAITLFAAGASIPLAVVLYYRTFLAPPTGDFATLTFAAAVHKMTEPARYVQIINALWGQLVLLGRGVGHPAVSLMILAAGLGVPRARLRQPVIITSFAVLLAVCAGYFFAYVVTPLDLKWHLGTSLPRLLVQVLPSFVFLWLAVLRTAEETAIPTPAPKKAARADRKGKKRTLGSAAASR